MTTLSPPVRLLRWSLWSPWFYCHPSLSDCRTERRGLSASERGRPYAPCEVPRPRPLSSCRWVCKPKYLSYFLWSVCKHQYIHLEYGVCGTGYCDHSLGTRPVADVNLGSAFLSDVVDDFPTLANDGPNLLPCHQTSEGQVDTGHVARQLELCWGHPVGVEVARRMISLGWWLGSGIRLDWLTGLGNLIKTSKDKRRVNIRSGLTLGGIRFSWIIVTKLYREQLRMPAMKEEIFMICGWLLLIFWKSNFLSKLDKNLNCYLWY